MKKDDFWRKLNEDVKSENISSFRSFKKGLNKTTDGDNAHSEEPKIEEPAFRETTYRGEVPEKNYYDADDDNNVDAEPANSDVTEGSHEQVQQPEAVVQEPEEPAEDENNSEVSPVAENVSQDNGHTEPDIQLPPDTNAAEAKDLQEEPTQKVDEPKENNTVVAETAAGTASSFPKVASEAEKTVTDKATDAVRPGPDSSIQEQPADSKNKKLIAMIVAAIVVCGLSGYFLLGGSSGRKETAARPAAGQTNKVSIPDSNQKTKPVEKPVPLAAVKQDTARNAFISFHKAITNRQLADAYNILSPDYQRFVKGYDNFARGYTTTLRSDVVELNTVNENSNFAVLTYKLKAEDQVDGGKLTQYFVGKAQLIKINGQWRIDSTEAKKASQNSKVALNMVKIVAKGEVNLRANPTTNANAVGVVREGDLVELLETGTCTDSSAAIVISDDVYVSSGSKRTQLGKGMAIKIVRDTGREIICRVNIDNRPTDVRFAPNHLVKLHGTTWYKVSSNGHTGWIYSNYARKQ